jgi:hypothetical protein
LTSSRPSAYLRFCTWGFADSPSLRFSRSICVTGLWRLLGNAAKILPRGALFLTPSDAFDSSSSLGFLCCFCRSSLSFSSYIRRSLCSFTPATKPFGTRGIFPVSLNPLCSCRSCCFGHSCETSSSRLICVTGLSFLLAKADVDKSLGVLGAACSCVICSCSAWAACSFRVAHASKAFFRFSCKTFCRAAFSRIDFSRTDFTRVACAYIICFFSAWAAYSFRVARASEAFFRVSRETLSRVAFSCIDFTRKACAYVICCCAAFSCVI